MAFCQALARAQTTAGFVMSLPYSISAALTPILGKIVDWYGQRGTLVVMSSFVLMLTHVSLAVTSIPAQ